MKHVTRNTNQEGVTLLLAILIMASIALISLSVGAFAIQELRASRAVTLTEPAISGADTGAEQSMYWLKTNNAQLVNCSSGTTYETLSNNTRVSICKSYGSATFNLVAGTPQIFYLYDPAGINSDTDLSGYRYSWFSITENSGAYGVTASIIRLDGTSVGSATATVGSPAQISIPAVGGGSEGRMQVTLTVPQGSAGVTINTDRGMPTYPTMDVSGCSSRTSVSDCLNPSQETYIRRINVSVPQQ